MGKPGERDRLSMHSLTILLILLTTVPMIVETRYAAGIGNSTGYYGQSGVKAGQPTRYFKLEFTYGMRAPDNFLQEVILTNGEFPGPTLRCRQDELLIVDVVNKLRRGFSVHYHGIREIGTMDSDGAPEITQTEIPVNATFRYVVNIGDQFGTFIWHAHTRLDVVWAFGPLVIDPKVATVYSEYKYDLDRTFMLTQCWHETLDSIYDGIIGSPFQDIPDVASILINGQSYGKWNGTFAPDMSEGYGVVNVQPGSIYRFRVIGLGSDSMLTFRIENHLMTIIEVDGTYIKPVVTDHLEVNVAQRYSVLVHMDQKPGNFWIISEMLPGPGPKNGRAVMHYTNGPSTEEWRKTLFMEQTEELPLTKWIADDLRPNFALDQPALYPVPEDYDVQLTIRSHQRTNNGRTQFTINKRLFGQYDVPLLRLVREGKNISAFEPLAFEFLLNKRIQIVFQNLFSDEGVCEQHPWHMHGHTFWIVGNGPDEFINSGDQRSLISNNIKSQKIQFRDVLTLFPNRTDGNAQCDTSCGWTAIRFIADNPGVWLIHCHITAHLVMGKKFVLYEHSKNDPFLYQTPNQRLSYVSHRKRKPSSTNSY